MSVNLFNDSDVDFVLLEVAKAMTKDEIILFGSILIRAIAPAALASSLWQPFMASSL